jgi:uncharacterized membrane protein YccC
MYSGQDSISTQHHAGKTRIPRATTEEILEITPDELRELQQAMLLHTQGKNKQSKRKSVLHIANMDTNTMLQQIRARKKSQEEDDTNADAYATKAQPEQGEGEDSIIEGDDEENYQDAEEHGDTDSDESMEEGTSEHEDRTIHSNEDADSYDPFDDQVIDHEQISQSVKMDNEPPTPMREGGRG